MDKTISLKGFVLVMIFLVNINANDIIGVWNVDKSQAHTVINNVISEDEKFIIDRLITDGFLKELDFKERGIVEYTLVSDIKGSWKYENSTKTYLVKVLKDLGQIILIDKNSFVFKNLLGKNNLNIVYKRATYSKVRRKKTEDKSKIYMNKVYRSNLVTDSNFKKGVYHYIIFSDEYLFYDIATISKDIEVKNIEDMRKIEKEQMESYESNTFETLEVEVFSNRKNPIIGLTSGSYNIKNNVLIASYNSSFSSIFYDPEIEKYVGGVKIKIKSRNCKKIQIVTKKKLKCENGMVYFLL